MRVRPMMLEDLDEIVGLENILFTDAWSKKSFETEITRNKYSIPVVLETEKKIIGYAVLWKIFDEFHIANFAIHPEYQGQKLGQFLLTESLNNAADCDYAFLEVREGNIKAINLYLKFGFETVLKRDYYYKDGEAALVMRKKLTEND